MNELKQQFKILSDKLIQHTAKLNYLNHFPLVDNYGMAIYGVAQRFSDNRKPRIF